MLAAQLFWASSPQQLIEIIASSPQREMLPRGTERRERMMPQLLYYINALTVAVSLNDLVVSANIYVHVGH